MTADAWGCLALEVEADRDELLAPDQIERLAGQLRAVLELDTTYGHRFEPIGFSLIAFGAAGRFAIHTWPEYRFATIDIWSCLRSLDARRAPLATMLATEGYRLLANVRLT
jgi:S-adenosylmethionine/arginine decarboxylase-like enzyme